MTIQIRNTLANAPEAEALDDFATPPAAPLDMPQQVIEVRNAERLTISNMIRLLVPRQWA